MKWSAKRLCSYTFNTCIPLWLVGSLKFCKSNKGKWVFIWPPAFHRLNMHFVFGTPENWWRKYELCNLELIGIHWTAMSPIQGIWSLLFLQVRDLQWEQHRKRGFVLCVARGWLLFIIGLQNEEVYIHPHGKSLNQLSSQYFILYKIFGIWSVLINFLLHCFLSLVSQISNASCWCGHIYINWNQL